MVKGRELQRLLDRGFYDEMSGGAGEPRPHARSLVEFIDSLPQRELLQQRKAAELLL